MPAHSLIPKGKMREKIMIFFLNQKDCNNNDGLTNIEYRVTYENVAAFEIGYRDLDTLSFVKKKIGEKIRKHLKYQNS